MAYILLADDQPKVIVKAAKYLREQGHRVVVVEDGQAAIDHLQQGLPDVVVTDIMMPRKDGFYVLDELRRLDPAHGTGLAVMDGPGSTGEVWRNWALSEVDNYIVKPASHWTVVIAVEQLLNRILATPPILVCTHRLEILNIAIEHYARWHEGRFPAMSNIDELKEATADSGLVGDEALLCPETGQPYVTSPALSRKTLRSIRVGSTAVTVYEAVAAHDGTHGVGTVTRTVPGEFGLRWSVRRVSPEEWRQMWPSPK